MTTIKFERVTEERYYEMLEMLPPAMMLSYGFLVGEAWTHQPCRINGNVSPAYSAFVERDGEFFESLEPVTPVEFRRLMINNSMEVIS